MHINSNKTLRLVFAPVIAITRWLGRNYPETLVRIRYFARFHKRLNLKEPKTLNEKIQWLSFRTDTSEWTRLSDKHAVREFVKERGLEDILIPQYAHYSSAEEIDFDKLPERFVLKTTHGSGDVLIVRDKSKHDVNEVKKFFAGMLKHRYGELEGGQHYMRIEPGLTVEALLENDVESQKVSSSIIDYKFWCFNGEPRYCWVCYNRTKAGAQVMTYDLDWQAHPEWSSFDKHYSRGEFLPKPSNYDNMLTICRKLAEGFPCVCVDLYNLGGKIFFGEMTFTRLGGLMTVYSDDFQLQMGGEVRLPQHQ